MSSVADQPRSEASSGRLLSLDALRGFDMFWIIGAGSLVDGLDRMGRNSVTEFLATQLSHVDWAGFRFYDLIFPMFVFIAGVSSVWSLTKEMERHGRVGAAQRVIRRGLLLLIFGFIYSGGFVNEWPNIRVLGVLQRIGFAYMGAGLVFLFFGPRARVAICAGLLVGYWGLMSFVPIRDIQLDHVVLAKRAADAGDLEGAALFKAGVNPSSVKDGPAWALANRLFDSTTNRISGKFEKGLNLSNHTDFKYLPGKRYDNYYDPEGLLSTIPAVGTCLLGMFAGMLLRSGRYCDQWKLIYLASAGVLSVLLGFAWGLQFPVIKKLWTSSFVLVAGGYSALLLATFYWIVEVRQWRGWCQPFVWIGMNSITVYMANNIIGFRKLAERLVGGDVRTAFEVHIAKGAGDLLIAFTGLGFGILLCWFLNRKKIYLRL